MWNELESYKNQYLQKQLPAIKAEKINEMVKKEHTKFTTKKANKHDDKCYPIKVCKCNCKASSYFEDRAPLAYGFYALPKLLTELSSENRLTRYRAIVSLTDYLRNPLHAQRAITEFEIVRRISNVYLHEKLKYHEEYKDSLGKLLDIFHALSFYLNGAESISRRAHLKEEFYKSVLHKEKHMHLVAEILRNLSEKPEVLLALLEEKTPFLYLSKIFMRDICVPEYPHPLWMHLSHFLELAPEKGIEFGFFEILHKRIVGKLLDYHKMTMKCFALLLRCEEGQRRFDVVDGVQLIYKMCSSNEYFNSYEFIILALLNGLHSKRALWRAREFSDLPDIVTRLARRTTNKLMQLYCLQTLRQLSEIPCIKRYMQNVCLKSLGTMNGLNKLNDCTRDELLRWLNTEVYEKTN